MRSPVSEGLLDGNYYTSTSREVLMANAWDVDGDFEYVQFFVNGANSVLQFKGDNNNLSSTELTIEIKVRAF